MKTWKKILVIGALEVSLCLLCGGCASRQKRVDEKYNELMSMKSKALIRRAIARFGDHEFGNQNAIYT